MRCATVYLHAVFFICPFKQSAVVSRSGGGSAINVWVIWRNKLTWNRWRSEEGCRTESSGQYVSSERRCLIRVHLSALMCWCNCPSLPRWPSWSERRALMMLNYVNIILNWLFNEVSGFADQRTAALEPNIPPVLSLWMQPLCEDIKHFNGLILLPRRLSENSTRDSWDSSDFTFRLMFDFYFNCFGGGELHLKTYVSLNVHVIEIITWLYAFEL